MKKDTQCVHSGVYSDRSTRGINTPIFTSSSYEYLDVSENVYPRYFNTPNQKAVVEKLCALENAEDGLLFSSGMAAISTVVFSLLSSGDHVILQRDVYGCQTLRHPRRWQGRALETSDHGTEPLFASIAGQPALPGRLP